MAESNVTEIRIAYFGYGTKGWLGGINYLKNTLSALTKSADGEIRPVIFFKKYDDPEIRRLFEPMASCIILDHGKPVPFILKVIDKLLLKKTDFFTRYYLKKNNIKIIAQSDIDTSLLGRKTIGWIPDFQHLHYPDLFSESELINRDIKHKKLIRMADAMIVSSNDAAKDLFNYYPGVEKKTHILHFVSDIDPAIYSIDESQKSRIENRYNFKGKFFFMPNKFWKHKNHIIVFEAIKRLRDEGIEALLICTGEMEAWESEDYIKEVESFINSNSLEVNIKTLGIIDYFDVQYLLRYSISVINPSLFEGWSTSVEECKSLGKNIILSDIPVHREQNPQQAIYFNPQNVEELYKILKTKWTSSEGGPDFDLEEKARRSMAERIRQFGVDYVQVIKSVI